MIKVNGREVPWEEGMTIARLLQNQKYTYPAIIVAINGVAIKEEEFNLTPIEDGDKVTAIHMVAGG